MDIRNVANHGNVDRAGDRAQRAPKERTVVIPSVVADDARISDAGRGAAARIDRLAERARDDGDREQLVAAALAKLQAGELDTDEVLGATARALLDGDFKSV